MTDVILVLDSQGRHLKVAPTKSINFYVPAADCIGKTVHELFPRATADLFIAGILAALAEGQMKKLEYCLPLEGQEKWFEASISPLSADTTLWIARDITERKKAEEKIRQSEGQLAEAQQLAHVGSWNWDLLSNTLTWSDQHYHIFGLRPGEIDPAYDSVVAKHIHPEDRDSIRKVIKNSLETLQPFDFFYRIVRADGVRVLHSRGNVAADEQGKPIRMFGSAQDVTEVTRAEEELRRLNIQLESERRRLNNIVATVPGMVWEAWGQPDAATQRIDFVSDYVETLLGYSVAQWLSTPNFWLSIVHPDDKERVARQAAESYASLSNRTTEFRWLTRDGRVVWVESNYAVVPDEEGRPAGLRGVNVDITERKQLEEQLRQAQKLQAIGTLAGGIAHDFNNILAIVIGYSELAQTQLTEGSRACDHLEQVLMAAARGRNLVQQIVTFSCVESHEREALQLQPLIDETLTLLRGSLPSSIEIRQHIDTSIPSVCGDSTQIQQVIMNLCVNAAQAMKNHGGVLEIRLTYLDSETLQPGFVPDLKEGLYVRLTVSDTGCGMDRATQERIFEPFFTTKDPGEGTGLGLAVVHGVVKNHGGAINIRSQPGAGTTFNIYLPVYPDPVSAMLHNPVPVPQENGEHLLLQGIK
jgi:PAS domain S-box-containing protein